MLRITRANPVGATASPMIRIRGLFTIRSALPDRRSVDQSEYYRRQDRCRSKSSGSTSLREPARAVETLRLCRPDLHKPKPSNRARHTAALKCSASYQASSELRPDCPCEHRSGRLTPWLADHREKRPPISVNRREL